MTGQIYTNIPPQTSISGTVQCTDAHTHPAYSYVEQPHNSKLLVESVQTGNYLLSTSSTLLRTIQNEPYRRNDSQMFVNLTIHHNTTAIFQRQYGTTSRKMVLPHTAQGIHLGANQCRRVLFLRVYRFSCIKRRYLRYTAANTCRDGIEPGRVIRHILMVSSCSIALFHPSHSAISFLSLSLYISIYLSIFLFL